MSKLLKKDQGFTLIEVVIVLAIAALIILVVLQAVGAANKSNRDTARKTEAGRIVSLLEQYASNNGGKYPTVATTLTDGAATNTASLYSYDAALDQKYKTVAGGTYATGGMTGAPSCGTVDANTYTLQYVAASTARDYNLNVCLESGGSSSLR